MVLISKSKTMHERKRHGQHHHKSSKQYAKTYWPYLPMLLLVVGGIFLNLGWNTVQGVLGYATNTSAVSLLQETNTARTQNGLGALSMNNQLAQAAQAKANDMVARDYWSHVTPDGKQPWQFITSAGYSYSSAGENLAYGFASSNDTVTGWMNSPEHRANVLSLSYKDVGFGIANSSNFQGSGEETVVVAMYGAPATVTAPVASKPKPSVVPPATPVAPATQSKNTVTEQVAAAPVAPEPQTAQTPAKPATVLPTPAPTDTNNGQVLAAHQLARIDLLTSGNSAWVSLAISAIACVGAISLALRHGRYWKKVWVEEKEFVHRHPFLDTLIVALAVASIVITHTAGYIH